MCPGIHPVLPCWKVGDVKILHRCLPVFIIAENEEPSLKINHKYNFFSVLIMKPVT